MTASRVRVRGWWLLAVCAVGGILAPWPAAWVEPFYSRSLYPLIAAGLVRVTNVAPVAFIDVGLMTIAAWLIWRVTGAIRTRRQTGVRASLWLLARRIVRLAAAIAMAFLAVWGLNYRRVPLEAQLGGDPGAPVDRAAVLALAEEATEKSGEFRRHSAPLDEPVAVMAARLEPSFREALRRLGLPTLSVVGRPKHSLVLTPFFTAAGVTGMVNPVLLESMVHPELLPFERPMVLAHEWAHLAGLADEADASAVGWLACRLAGGDLAYSAHFSMLLETASVIPRDDWRRLRTGLPEGVEADIRALAARVSRAQPQVQRTATRVYDGYLRTNRVDDGVRSYSRVIRVAVAPGMRAADRQRP
jgi:hypothetical protein